MVAQNAETCVEFSTEEDIKDVPGACFEKLDIFFVLLKQINLPRNN